MNAIWMILVTVVLTVGGCLQAICGFAAAVVTLKAKPERRPDADA